MQSLDHFDLRTLNEEASKAPAPTSDKWNEVPRALFSSWSRARQLDYCLRRDLASAADPKCWEGNLDKSWFLTRAEGYKIMLNEELKKSGLTPRD